MDYFRDLVEGTAKNCTLTGNQLPLKWSKSFISPMSLFKSTKNYKRRPNSEATYFPHQKKLLNFEDRFSFSGETNFWFLTAVDGLTADDVIIIVSMGVGSKWQEQTWSKRPKIFEPQAFQSRYLSAEALTRALKNILQSSLSCRTLRSLLQ